MRERIFHSKKDLQDILVGQVATMRNEAQRMPRGVARDRLLKQARQLEVSANLDAWSESPGLQRPT